LITKNDNLPRRGGSGAYTGKFFRKGASEVGCVILSAAKDLSPGQAQILRCAQDDSLWRPARFKKPTRANPRIRGSFQEDERVSEV
jgi:hypothetical protein